MELLKKLRIDTEKPLWLINAPDDVLHLFDGLELRKKTGKEKPLGQIVLFAYNRDELIQSLVKLESYIAHGTVIWIAYPKKSGSLQSDLAQMQSWDMVFTMGYRAQTSVAINADWSSLRITNAPPKNPSTYNLPPEERNIEGIDFVNRTVALPADALKEVRKHKGMEDYFNKLAFTHKKEHVVAILDAKKAETRQRRIEKMIEMLLQKMQAKK